LQKKREKIGETKKEIKERKIEEKKE